MNFKKLPRGVKKFIRFEKARIRREILDPKKQEKAIRQLYEKIFIKKSKQGEIKI